MKKIFILLSLFACVVPQISHAQVDQRCWTEDACYDARKSLFGLATPEKGKPGWEKVFRQDDTTEKLCGLRQDAVGTKVGFCLPATTAKIKISIGGQNEFAGLGEFVAFIYKYGMGVAGILSVLMIIFAGVQWIVSAGSSEAISSAKHRITGAVIGLIILATAYTILYTINPDLVNLRPPNAWMINTQKISAPSCSQITKGQISKDPSNDTGKALTAKEKQDGFNAVVATASWGPTSTAQCGKDYFVQSTGALTCSGNYCDKSPDNKAQACYDKLGTGKLDCYPANLLGDVFSSSVTENLIANGGIGGNAVGTFIIAEGWEWRWVNQPELWAVCKDGKHQDIDADNNDPDKDAFSFENTKRQFYQFTIETNKLKEKSIEWCIDQGSELKGFVIDFDINREGNLGDEEHFIGRTQGEKTFDLGDQNYDDIECILREAPAEHFFSFDEINNGKRFDVDVNQITRLASTQASYSRSKTGETAPNRKTAYGAFASACF